MASNAAREKQPLANPKMSKLSQTKASKKIWAAQEICVGDCCIGAVKRSYDEMRQVGQSESVALQTATRVLRWYHPDLANDTAALLVHDWVKSGQQGRH
jgi:hypothetical protein